MVKTRKEIDQWLWKNYRRLTKPEFYFGADNNQSKAEDFDNSPLKILVLFFSSGSTRSVSNTFNALFGIVQDHIPETFMDFCYFPEQENWDILTKAGMPWAFGNVSHAPWSDYDMIFASVSLTPESFNVPFVFQNSGIPLSFQERMKTKTPLIGFGGASANALPIMFGETVKGSGNRSLVDFGMFGAGEEILPQTMSHFLNFMKGKDTKDPVNKQAWLDALKEDSFEKKDFIYHPLAYDYTYNPENGFEITKITKNDDRLPDRVSISRITSPDFPGFTKKAFYLTGENSESTDIMISWGCSGHGTCSFSFAEGSKVFTENGIMAIEDLVRSGTPLPDPQAGIQKYSLNTKVDSYKGVEEATFGYVVGQKPCLRITTEDGFHLDVTKDHTCTTYIDGALSEVVATNLAVGDTFLVKAPHVESKGVPGLKKAEARFLGWLVSTGYVDEFPAVVCQSRIERYYFEEVCRDAGVEIKNIRQEFGLYIVELSHDIIDKHGLTYDDRFHIPAGAYTYTRSQMISFLQGVIDSHITKNNRDIVTSDKTFADTLRLFFLYINIFVETSISNTEGNHLPVYILSIDKAIYKGEYGLRTYCRFLNNELGSRILESKIVKIHDIGVRNIYDITVEPSHLINVNGIITKQCLEGAVAGSWVEKSVEALEENMKSLRKSCAPNSATFFSYNTNYYHRLFDLLYKTTDHFSNISLLKMRCIDKDERITTSRGLVRAEDVKVGDQVYDGEKFVLVTDYEVKPTEVGCLVTLSNGQTLKCTKDHPFKLSDGSFVDASYLEAGQEVLLSGELETETVYHTFPVPPGVIGSRPNNSELEEITLDEDFAAYLGWVAGDGSVLSDGAGVQLKMHIKEQPTLEKYVEFLNAKGWRSEVRNWPAHPQCCETITYSQQLNSLLTSIGAGGDCYVKRVPEAVFTSPKTVIASYLRGLFSADGHISLRTTTNRFNKNGLQTFRQIKLELSSESLIRDSQQLLQMLGIKSYVLFNSKKDTHSLVVYVGYIKRFLEVVGFDYPKNDLTEEQLRLLDLPVRQSNITPTVVSVEEWVVSPVGHTVEGGVYVTNGIITHNSDGLASQPELLDISKKLGLLKVSFAVEGMGERIRNRYLNKNLSKETLLKAMDVVYDHRFMGARINMIVTGEETDADIDEWLQELDEIEELKQKKGARLSLSLTHTPLVIYDATALRYRPRKMAKASLENSRTLHRYIAALKERGIGMKFHGSGPGTFIEQTLLDLGPAGTPVLVECSLNGLDYIRHFNDKDRDIILNSMKKHGISVEALLGPRSLDYIFPTDTIQITTDKILEEWKEMERKQDWYQPICLKTTANPKGICATCGHCDVNPELRKNMITRSLENEHTIPDVVMAMSENRHNKTLRVTVKKKAKWDLYNSDGLSHYITSRMMQHSELIERSFHSVGKNTNSWTTDKQQICWLGGLFTYDLNLKEHAPLAEFKRVIPLVNKDLEVAEIVDIYESDRDISINTKGSNLYLGTLSNVSMSFLRDRLAIFDWDVQVAIKGMGTGLMTEKKYMPELKERISFSQKNEDILVTMTLPRNVNPYLVLSSILKKNLQWSLENSRFSVMDSGKELELSCKCGKPVEFSEVNNAPRPECFTCSSRKLLYSLTATK